MHQSTQCAFIESARMPFVRIISLYCRYIQTAIQSGDSAVTKERQRFSIRHFFVCGQQSACIPNGQQSGGGPTARTGYYLSLARTLLSYSQAIRHHRESDTLRQRYKLARFKRSIVERQSTQARLLLYFSIGSAVYHIGNSH